MSKFCMNCGSALEEGSKFCGACGSPVEAAPSEPETPYAQPVGEPQSDHEEEVPYAQAIPFDKPAEPQPEVPYAQAVIPQAAPQEPVYPRQNAYAPQGGQQAYPTYAGGYQQPAANGQQYGRPQYAPYPQQPNYYDPKKKKNRTLLIIILTIAGVAVFAVILSAIISGLNGSGSGSGSSSGSNSGSIGGGSAESGPDSVMEQVIRYTFTTDRDADKLGSLVYECNFARDPEYKEDLLDYYHALLDEDNFNSSLINNYGEDYEVTYTIEYSEKMTGEDFNDAVDYFYDCYTDDIEEIVYADVILSINGSKNSDDTELNLYFVKADGKWYVDEDILS